MVFSANIDSKPPPPPPLPPPPPKKKTPSEPWILRYGSKPAAQTEIVRCNKTHPVKFVFKIFLICFGFVIRITAVL